MFWRITWFEISYWLRSKMLWVFLGVIALSIVFAAVHAQRHIVHYSDQYLPQRSLCDQHLLLADQPCHAAHGSGLCELSGAARFQIQHEPDCLFHADEPPRLPSWTFYRSDVGIDHSNAGRLSRDFAGEVHAMGGSRTVGTR